MAENSMFITLGTATDLFAERRDPYSPPKAGMPFGLSIADLSTHILALGQTGTGKTAAVIRPVVWQWQEAKAGGLLVLDGKGQLPKELAGLPNYQVISPESSQFNAIQNLPPDEVADTLFQLFTSTKGNSGDVGGNEWEQFARELLRSTAKVLALMNALEPAQWPWNLSSIYRLAFEAGSRDAAKALIENEHMHLLPGHLHRAYSSFMVRHMQKANETRSSIELNLETWLGTLINDQELGSWADCVDGVEIEDCLYGEKIGLALPDSQTGVAISALAKRRFYTAIKRRGDGWKSEGQEPVLLVVDEAQDLVSHEELAILPKARSLGLCALYSTQGLDGLQVALKDEQATIMLLDQFRSVVSLQVGSDMTLNYVSQRLGTAPRVVFSEVNANTTDPAATANLYGANAGGYSTGTLAARAQTSEEMIKVGRSYSHVGQAISTVAELAKKLGVEQAWQQLPAAIRRERPAGSVKIGEIPLVSPDEVRALTMNKFTALAAVNRCGTIRRAQIRLTPMFSFPTETKTEQAAEEVAA
ncbi:type IV secretory system conjugative DNA transfer family protein [Pseudomonas aeruginosa]|uniref:TraD/TraG TraM recognition site domain-containing protein n=2 Tax=Ectopseudomonas oleovorans TaxID=301 RepID=A0A2T5PI38_ECTOL|nr:hypothetical protein DBO86_20305 [Pseudomonas indoloxydans]RNF58169.1 type IV secretory system conjugative DNA transfer family protein [Pseudomonas aeruginosa]